MIADKIVNIFWSTIKDYRGDALPYLYSSFDSCLYVLYCLYKGYHVHIDISDALRENPIDQILQSLEELASKESNEEITMRSLRIRAKFLDSILTELHPDDIKKAYPSTISKLLTYSANTKDMLMYFTPAELVRVISRILRKYNVKHVYNPFAGTAAFCSELDESVSYIGEDNDPRAVTYALIRIDSLQLSNSNVHQDDSFALLKKLYQKKEYEEKYIKELSQADAIITYPDADQWGELRTDPQITICEETAYSTKAISVGIFSYDILYGERSILGGLIHFFRDTLHSGTTPKLRQRLLEDDYIQAVIKLPTKLFAPKKRNQSCVIITNKRKSRKGMVQFIDATQCVDDVGKFSVEVLMEMLDNLEESHFAKWISCKDLLKGKGAHLAIEPLLYSSINIPDGFRLKRLGDLIVSMKGSQRTGFSPDLLIPIINVRDLSRKPFEDRLTNLKMASSKTDVGAFTYLDRNALLISTESKLCATYYSYAENGAFAGDNVAAYSIKKTKGNGNKVSLRFLIRELWQPYVQNQLVYRGNGSCLALDLFEEVRILVPDKFQEQENLVEEILQKQLSDKDRELQKTYEEYKEEIRLRKHAMLNTLPAVILDLENVMFFMEHRGGDVYNNGIVGLSNPLSAKQMLDSILKRLYLVEEQIDNLNAFDDNYDRLENIDLDKYVRDYIKNCSTSGFKYSYVPFPEKLPTIKMSRRDIDTIFINIVSNARTYGFVDANKTDYMIDISINIDENRIILEIANNGSPLDSNLNPEDVFTYLKSSKLRQDRHMGSGGFHIKRLLERYGATVEFISTPQSYFTVMYRIIFNI